MKVWNGYGSEHSMNLVLIGKFKRVKDAEDVVSDIAAISELAVKEDAQETQFAVPENQRFSDEMLELLMRLNINILGPTDIGQLISDHRLVHEADSIRVMTDEPEVSAFLKLFVDAGAKVEVYSAHDYPSSPAAGN